MERFIRDYFRGWLDAAQEDERRRRTQKQEEAATFAGFGQNDDRTEDWEQWVDFLMSQLEEGKK